MLYVTTRNNHDAFTANHALTENRAEDGGFYLPFRMPKFSDEEIASLEKKSFGQCVADILNRMFNARITSRDVDFFIGRCPVRITSMTQRITLGETWHNPEWDFLHMAERLIKHINGDDSAISDWGFIAVRIAVLFGLFGKMMRKGLVDLKNPIDVAVLSGDFSAPMAAWYARSWGLPIANIILCCNENNAPWELLRNGELRTNTIAAKTATPDADFAIPTDLERFVHECGGYREAGRFVDICRMGKTYVPSEFVLENMRKGMHVSVVGDARVASAIPNVYRSHGCILDPYTALIYSGLMDYRSVTGESRGTMILSEKGPGYDAVTVAERMGITVEELHKKLKMT